MQNPIIYLVLRRLRAPLILLILSYTIAVVGLTIIPGIDDKGEVWHVSYFHAFYFFSYVATTIGFGEIPYEFTDTQRLWVTFCIYLTVISWLVAIGKIISLLQDKTFKLALERYKFVKRVKKINSKFCIICGYGETGEILVHSLNKKDYICVVIDSDESRVSLLTLDSSILFTPYLHADASDVNSLKMAGIDNPNCRAVIAITNSDTVNVKIAVASRLLQKTIKIVCRADSNEAIDNVKSFNTDHVFSLYNIFATNISMAIRMPTVQQLLFSLLRQPGRNYPKKLDIPVGLWIICGGNSFGLEMAKYLEYEGADVIVIDENYENKLNRIKGRGTEAITLREANINKAVGIVAATENDADNLSIIITSKRMNNNIYTVARQNNANNREIFKSASINFVMERSRHLVWHISPVITQPYLASFSKLVRHKTESWAIDLIKKMQSVSEKIPETYLLQFNKKHAQASLDIIDGGTILRLQDIFISPNPDEPQKAQAIPLMLTRNGEQELLPKLSTPIKPGDVFLMASDLETKIKAKNLIHSSHSLYYFLHGKEKPVSLFAEYLREKKRQRKINKRHKKQTPKITQK